MVKWNPYLDEESSEFYRTVFSFAQEKIFPSAEERDEKEIWVPAIWDEICKAGLAGLPIPEEYGGQSASCFQSCLAAEAVYSGCLDGGLGLSWAAHMIIGSMPIVLQGNDFQKKKYLPKLASGEWIAGFALTEPDAGSDAGSLSTRAEKVEGGYILNGSKIYITNGPIGQVFIVMARTGGKSRGPMGISAFIVESNYKGFQVSKVLRKLGHHTSMTAELVFEDMFVPEENLLGPLNSGFLRIGKSILEWERTVLIAGVVGAIEYALEASIRYAQEREQFGKSISNFYAIQEKLVKFWIYMNASRIYEYYVAKLKDQGKSMPMECSIIKLFSSELGEEVGREVIQVFGGYGFMKEYHVERMYRDMKLGTIGGGTSEIQRSIIATSFRDVDTFIDALESTKHSIPGWNGESIPGMELMNEKYSRSWELVLGVLKDTAEYKKSLPRTHQSFDFAFADWVCMVSVMDRYRMTILEDSNWYTKEDKILDSYLCMDFLMDKYSPSLFKLGAMSKSATELLKNHISSVDDCNDESKRSTGREGSLPYSLERRVEACFQFLEKRHELR